MREIKFRAWDPGFSKYVQWEWFEINYNMRVFNSHSIILEQFTGLRDKNGKEIYEGDIILWMDSKKYIVEWNYQTHEWILHNRSMKDFLEIIGNIHENPELIEEVENEETKRNK